MFIPMVDTWLFHLVAVENGFKAFDGPDMVRWYWKTTILKRMPTKPSQFRFCAHFQVSETHHSSFVFMNSAELFLCFPDAVL